MRDIGKRIAAEGYSVLVPNPFYRVAAVPMFDSDSSFDFENQADTAKLRPLMASVNAPDAAERDAIAYVAFLDAQSEVNKATKIGTQGSRTRTSICLSRARSPFPASLCWTRPT
jgi:carboxymethylenebutenolidase